MLFTIVISVLVMDNILNCLPIESNPRKLFTRILLVFMLGKCHDCHVLGLHITCAVLLYLQRCVRQIKPRTGPIILEVCPQVGMSNRLSRPVPFRPATGSSSSGSRRVRPARVAVSKMRDQTRPTKIIGLCGLARGNL